MKTFKQLRESIIDIPRSVYAPLVFDDADTSNPKIKQSVLDMIENQIKEFETEYPVIKIALIGSILTKRYRNDADLDINVLFDVPADKAEDERLRLSKKYLSVSNPDNIQGKDIPGSQHPVNYYFITDEETYDDQNTKADAVFDIRGNKFIKRPDDFDFDKNLYLKDFEKKVQELDVIKGELKRDIIDYDELKELKPGEIKNLQDELDIKLKEIEKDLQDIIDIGDTVDAERRSAFDTEMTPDEIRTYGIKNRLPKNVIYKMLEKYHYLTFFKRCKKILDDGEVSDTEIDSLKGGYVEHAQSKTRAVNEALDKGNKLIFAFGRFNPPTTGHGKLMKEVIIQARKNNANHIVYASASTDKRKNPLDVKTKVKFMKKMFPENKIQAAGGTQRTFMEILKFYDKMYGEIIMIAGSDRINEFQKLADKYNGKDYNYKSIKVVSSGERDPDAEGVTGMSASKMREMAKNDDYRSFKTGIVGLSATDSKALFNAVKKGMGINERVESFTNFINNDLREEYHQEKIFNIGDMVEHMDGSQGMIIRRGSNYVSYESEGLIKKAWLYDLQTLDEAPTKMSFENYINEKRAKQAVAGGKVQKLVTAHGLKFKGKVYKEIDMELKGIDNNTQMVTFNIIHPKEIFGNEVKLAFKVLRRGPFMATDTSKINEAPRIPRKKGQPAGSDKHSDLYTDENPKGTIQGLGFKDVETARASVSKIKNSGKTHAHKIQAAVAMEQRAKEMGKSAEAKIYRTYIDKMKEKTKEMQKEDSIIDELQKEFSLPGNRFTDYLKSKTIDRKAVQTGISLFKQKMKSASVFKDKAGLAADIAQKVGVGFREFQDVLTSMGLLEYYEIGTDYAAHHTMSMTPGQPIQNFRRYTMKIDEKDIEKFANEGDTIDKYKKRYGESWKEELDKTLVKMRNQLQ